LTLPEHFLLPVHHGSQGAAAAGERDQVRGNIRLGKGLAQIFTGHAGIYGFGELGMINSGAPGDLADRVFVQAKPAVPLVAKNSKFLYSLTHFTGNPVGFFERRCFRAPSKRLMRVSFIKIKKKTYAM
jgi:hypothetical protein